MSDDAFVFLGLDDDESRASVTIDAQVEWLLERGIIIPAVDPNCSARSYRGGPALMDALDSAWVSRWRYSSHDLPYSGLQVRHGWHICDPGENFDPPPCPRCGATYAGSTPITDHLIEWHDTKTEPIIACPSCGSPSLVGDWDHVWFAYCTYASLSMQDWWPLNEDFRLELLHRIGRRPRFLYNRI